MADVNISTNKYLDLDGLKKYDAKIKALLDTKVSSIDAATAEALGLVKIGDGIAVDAGKISVKAKTNGAITVDASGVDIDLTKAQKATAATPGVVTVGDGLEVDAGKVSVEAKTDGGLAVDEDGVSLNLANNSGLEITQDKVAVKVKSSGGLTLDSNGLSVDWDNAPTDAILTGGTGIDIEDGTVSLDPDTITDASIPLSKITGNETLAKKSDLTNVYTYKGSVSTYNDLLAKNETSTAGDVWDVQDSGMNYAWTGTAWDPLGSTFTITSIADSDIDALFTA